MTRLPLSGLSGPALSSKSSPSLKGSASVPTLPSITAGNGHPITGNPFIVPFNPVLFSKKWAPEGKRLIHERRERRWLRLKAKHGYIDFSENERMELKRYFDALAGANVKMSLDKLEDMLISLGLAANTKDVMEIVGGLDGDCAETGELDFEEFLEIVRKRTDSDIFPVFKAMMEGKLGDHNLNFQTVLSSYRRHEILDFMCDNDKKKRKEQKMSKGEDILQNFATLQRSRYAEMQAASRGPDPTVLNFETAGVAPMGGLEMVWRGIVTEHNLASSRPASADGRSKRTLEPPLSPREVVGAVLKDAKPHKTHRGGTLIVREATMDNKDALSKQRSMTGTP